MSIEPKPKPDEKEHKYGLSPNGIPLTKTGRESRKGKPSQLPKRKGRPPKLKKPKGVMGRPKGTQTIINEYRDRMLNSPKSARVLEAIFDAALDSENRNQASAWKLVMDRIAPTAAFEQEITKGSGKSAIQINITGIGGAEVVGTKDDDISDAEYEVV